MNLIEEFGSYEKAKKHQIERALNGLLHEYDFELVDALLEYHRANNIFEDGDMVIDGLLGNQVIAYRDSYKFLGNGYVSHFVRHATPEEIKVGHRL